MTDEIGPIVLSSSTDRTAASCSAQRYPLASTGSLFALAACALPAKTPYGNFISDLQSSALSAGQRRFAFCAASVRAAALSAIRRPAQVRFLRWQRARCIQSRRMAISPATCRAQRYPLASAGSLFALAACELQRSALSAGQRRHQDNSIHINVCSF